VILDPRVKLAGIEPQRNFGGHVGAWFPNLETFREVPQKFSLNLEVFYGDSRAMYVKRRQQTELKFLILDS
jgi:hypothetical protein